MDVSAKIKKTDVKGYANHVFRNSLESRGKILNHSNQNIKKSETNENIDWFIDDKDFNQRFNERLATYNSVTKTGKPRKLRSDAVLIRGIVTQPSSDVFEGLSRDEIKKKMSEFSKDSLVFFVKEFGFDNVLGGSTHFDESNPHLHIAVMPMFDGKLSQKKYFTGPTQLKAMHSRYREYMNGLGWSFDTENKHEDSKHYKDSDYKRNAKAIEKARDEYTAEKRGMKANMKTEVHSELVAELEPNIKAQITSKYESQYNSRENDLNAREDKLEASTNDYDQKVSLMVVERQKIADDEAELKKRKKKLDEREKELKKRELLAESTLKRATLLGNRIIKVVEDSGLPKFIQTGINDFIRGKIDTIENKPSVKVALRGLTKDIEKKPIKKDGLEL